MNNNLIFDLELSGHHSEYISHLLDYLCLIKSEMNYIFVLHPDFISKFPDIANKAINNELIQLETIEPEEYKYCKEGNLIRRSLKSFRLMNKYATKYSAQKVFLMYFNTFQFAIGLFSFQYEIYGILYSQFPRMEKNNLGEKLKYLRKFLQTWFFLQNKQIKQVFILNDSSTAEYLNSKFKTNIFNMLPDPISDGIKSISNLSIRESLKIDSERKIFLHFGSLSIRKGTLDILDAFEYLGNEKIGKIAFILAGKANTNTDGIINSKISMIKKQYPNSSIVYKNEFVSDSLMKTYFEQCDVILVPYKNAEASSGIIGHAIASGKPVIGTKKGLLGKLILDNDLGILINESTPKFIAEGIHDAINNKIQVINNDIYLKAHSKELFASILLHEK